MGGDEPSWMSRVKRVAAGEDIVINRDDDSDEKIDLEKGDEARDTGRLAMFAVPTSSSKTASTSTEGKDEKGSTDGKDEKGSTDRNEKGGKDEGVKRTERQMESDDHPPLNILSEDPREHDSHEDGIKRKDTHYSAPHIDLLGNEDDHHVNFAHLLPSFERSLIRVAVLGYCQSRGRHRRRPYPRPQSRSARNSTSESRSRKISPRPLSLRNRR